MSPLGILLSGGQDKPLGFGEFVFEELLIVNEDGKFYTINHHVIMIFVAAFLMILLFVSMARSMKKKPLEVPGRFFSFWEVFINYVRYEVVEPNIGKARSNKYLPYFLTIFFFIFFMNALGLAPLTRTPTSKLGVTCVFALSTFIIMNVAGVVKKGFFGYWKLVPHGIPTVIAICMWPIELLGMISRILALMIRLFANMTGGHMVIIILLYMGMYYYACGEVSATGKAGITGMTVLIAVGIELLELFVSLVQAYIFTLLTAVFTGMAMEDH